MIHRPELRWSRAAVLAALLVCAHCDRGRGEANAHAGQPAIVQPSAAPAMPSGSSDATGDTLHGRLAREAANRPKISPNADDVLTQFAKIGASLASRQQSMGRTVDALYCTGGFTPDGSLTIHVCEYPDPASALAGRDKSKSLLPNLKGRDVWASKDTTVAIVRLKDDAATQALENKLVTAYQQL